MAWCSILPQFRPKEGRVKASDLQFWIAFITALYGEKTVLTAGASSADQHSQKKRDGNSFERVIDLCLEAATHSLKYNEPGTAVPGILELVGLCITHNDVDGCIAIFRGIASSEGGSVEMKFRLVYYPLMPQLRELLAVARQYGRSTSDIGLITQPFKGIMQALLGQLLNDFLGPRPRASLPATLTAAAKMRKIGCDNCQGCKTLDTFMVSNDTTKEYPNVNRLGVHLEERIQAASDIVRSYRRHPPPPAHGGRSTSDGPFTLVIQKQIEAHAIAQWTMRQKGTRYFLSAIGNDQDIVDIVGLTRYTDLQRALAGVGVYPSTAGIALGPLQGPGIPLSHPRVAGPTGMPMPVAGAGFPNTLKRKHEDLR